MKITETMETVTSKDGTEIAFKRTGNGPPFLLVHGGGAGDHTRWEIGGIRPSLDEHFTVYAIDRRGRGGSGDADPYNIEREYEDVAAVVDSIDEPVILLGHSMGANVSLMASLLTDNLKKLILYEPGILTSGHEYMAEGIIAKVELLLDKGENEKALELFLQDIGGFTPGEMDAFRSDPSWQSRIDAAHTLPREERAFNEFEFDPDLFTEMSKPTLLLSGSESPDMFKDATELVDSALSDSRIVVLDGQAHVAMNTAPELFIKAVLDFALE